MKLLNAIFSYLPINFTFRNMNGFAIKSSNSEKVLGATRGSNFTFEKHINSICQNVTQKLLHLLSRISQYLSRNKKRILFKTLETSLIFLFTPNENTLVC